MSSEVENPTPERPGHTPELWQRPSVTEAAASLLRTVVIALFVLTFVLQPFLIPSESMERTLLVGDFLLGQAFKMMVEVGNLHALSILSSAAAVIAEGEVMQLGAAKDTATNEDEYMAVIRAKTAELFAAACEVGPALAAKDKAELAACRSFGLNLGIAFQLIDDALDYGGKSARLGKNVGDDFREGKITLPVVLSFRRGGERERAFWNRTLGKGDICDGDLDEAIALIGKHHAIEDTVGRARHYGAIATDALALVPPSAIKTALEEAVAFCIARAH